jgi:3D-(3,5/4)-trihydroxycyclohexane-1,2-dione acylhydrolase (decyclizing)
VAIDFAANARSLGAHAASVRSHEELAAALEEARRQPRTTVIAVPVDREHRVGSYESWWDVPVAEVSDDPEVRAARERFQEAVRLERLFL